jgi:hypothetical protein
MFCSGCGQVVDPNQPVCLNCGRPVPRVAPVVVAPAPYFFYTRVHRHIQAVSILWIAYGAWTLVTWVLAMSFFTGALGGYFGHGHHGPFGEFPFSTMPWFAPLISVFVIGRTILSVATGLALVRRAPWARMLAIVVAFLTLIKPITGTALAIYTLWVLLPTLSAQEYEQIAEP